MMKSVASVAQYLMRFSLYGIVCFLWSSGLRAQSVMPDDPYARYTRPGQCLQAGMRLKQLYWRSLRPDTVVYAPMTDSIPQSVVQQVRLCLQRFDVTRVPARDLLSLAQMYIWVGDYDLGYAAVDRLLLVDTAATDARRGWVLYNLILSCIRAAPLQMSCTQSFFAKFDASGPGANYAKMLSHQIISQYALSLGDVPLALASAKQAIAYGKQLTANDRMDFLFAMNEIYETLAEPLLLHAGKGATLAMLDSAMNSLLTFVPSGTRDAETIRGQFQSSQVRYSTFDENGAPVRASHWYNRNSDSTTLPAPGRVTLLYFVNSACGGSCYSPYAALRRLHAKYAQRGLVIVLATSTVGYFRNHLQESPAQEAEQHRAYFFDFLKLPGILAVEATPYSHHSDGRRINQRTENQQNYGRGRDAFLIGKDGRVRWITMLNPFTELILSAEISRALEK